MTKNDPCLALPGLPSLQFVAQLKAGYNNDSSVYESAGGEKYVVRNKKYFGGYGTLEREARVCRFLEAMEIPFAQKSFYFDSNKNVHVVAHVDGHDVEPKNFTQEQAEIFARQVAQLHGIDPEVYKAWCKKENYPEPKVGNLDGFLTGALLEPEKIIAESCPDAQLKEWVQENVARAKKLISSTRPDFEFFSHGDLGGNMKWNGAELHFIDWECAGLRDGTDFGYIFVHGGLKQDMQNLILANYAEHRGLNLEAQEKLKKWTECTMALQKIDKVVYRAKRFSEDVKTNPEEADDFRRQAYQVLQEEFGGLKPNIGRGSNLSAPAIRFD